MRLLNTVKAWWNTKVVFTAEQRWERILWAKSNIPCPRKLCYHTSGYLSLSNLLNTRLHREKINTCEGTACKISIILSFSLPFLPKNACKQNPCKNNATCQAGFTDRDYQCLCVDGSGFRGHDCDEGKESYTFIKAETWCIIDKLSTPLP